MSDKDTGGTAYPAGKYGGGMTLLDYNAIEIGKARIAKSGLPLTSENKIWAKCNYDLAQVMINEKREREGTFEKS